MYEVPREYGPFEHLFKRLGAVEEATPAQFAKLLGRLQASCLDEKMHPNEAEIAKRAVYGLFSTLKALRDRNGGESANPLPEIERLYLPSKEQKLRISVDLVLFDCPQHKYRIPTAMYEPLDRLERYNLTFATHQQIADLLPAHLKIPSLRVLVREELHPECKDKKCSADVEKTCHETNRLRDILFSTHLVDGIIRILKYQFQKAKLTEVQNKVRSFQKELRISCMAELSTELVDNRSNMSIPYSQRSNIDCVVDRDEVGGKHIFINHGADPGNVRGFLCREINQLTGCYIDKESWLHLARILECESPEHISLILDDTGVSEDVEAADTQSSYPVLGTEVPEEFHHLLVQYDDFYFRNGAFVAFEKEDSTEDDPKYIYAKIVNKLPCETKPKEDNTIREPRVESTLLSRYLIDVGHGRKEVDVLDLYKLRRPQKVQENVDEVAGESASEMMDLVLYEGAARQSSEQEEAESPSSSQETNDQPKPRDLDAAISEVKEALAEIWKLPEEKRKKAIRRLYLRWHPDKNMDMQDIANEVIKFLQNEVERLSKVNLPSHDEDCARRPPSDFSDSFTQWDKRARRQRSSYEKYGRHNPRFTGFASHSRRTYKAPNPCVAKMWIRQSKEDLRSVELLLTAQDPLHYLVCFQSHQIAEKSLKAALYSISGVADRQLYTHDLVLLAQGLSLLPGAPDVILKVARLSNYYLSTRYPNAHRPPHVPAEVFRDSWQAQEAFRLATEVLEELERFVGT
ncbi:sacsin-like [Stylophora pistillata]|uniref:sacsin-like n=1 Tax=Stylophora pistillata TaxID=50429 RepID=UPI000C050284|nr:sacsin-like [Stylophora pistillata]